MRHGSLVFLLAISLLFNAFFLTGYLQHRAAEPASMPEASTESDQAITEEVTETLGLDETQAEIFAALRREMKDEERAIRDRRMLLRRELIEELTQPNADIDLERVRELVRQESDLHREMKLASISRFHEFIATLGPEQRDRLARRLPDMDRKRGSRDSLDRFDTDQDGRLSREEMEAARDRIDAHRRERADRRRQTLERFDADGDGRLNEAERRSAREWLRERFHRKDDGRPDRPDGSGDPEPRS